MCQKGLLGELVVFICKKGFPGKFVVFTCQKGFPGEFGVFTCQIRLLGELVVLSCQKGLLGIITKTQSPPLLIATHNALINCWVPGKHFLLASVCIRVSSP